MSSSASLRQLAGLALLACVPVRLGAQARWTPWQTISGSSDEDKCGVDYSLSYRDAALENRRFIWYRVRNRCAQSVIVRFTFIGARPPTKYEDMRAGPNRIETSWTTAIDVGPVTIATFDVRQAPRLQPPVSEITFPGTSREWHDASGRVTISWQFASSLRADGHTGKVAKVVVATTRRVTHIALKLWCNGDPVERSLDGPVYWKREYVVTCDEGDATGLNVLSVTEN